MRDVPKVQTERASESRSNGRRKMDLGTFLIWILFWTFRYQNWVFGTVFGIWSLLVSRYDIGSIGAIFGVQVTRFRHVFKGAVKLKGDIDLESDLRLGIGLMIGWILIWLVNKQT